MIAWDTSEKIFLLHSRTTSYAKAALAQRWAGQFLVLCTWKKKKIVDSSILLRKLRLEIQASRGLLP